MATPLDPVFRSYDSKQAATYSQNRGSSYAPRIIQEVISYHTAHGGQFGTVLDAGCGTGKATRNLAPYFDRAVGCDAGKEMIAQATQAGGESKDGSAIGYEVLDAEKLDRSTMLRPGSVDLLTAAMAAHWFHMQDFWQQAARMVRPGGTVAIWTLSSLYCHPATPNAEAVQRALSRLEDDFLGPYELPQNRLSRGMYKDLPLPWTLDESTAAAFPKELSLRIEWNRDGHLEPGEDDFFSGSDPVSLERLMGALGTSSMITRWRQAHPQLVGTEEDCVATTMRAVAEAMGVNIKDPKALSQTMMRAGTATVLLLFTRADTSDAHE